MNRKTCKESGQELMSGCELVGQTIADGRAIMRLYTLIMGSGVPRSAGEDETAIREAIVSILIFANDLGIDMESLLQLLLIQYQETVIEYTSYIKDPSLTV